MTSTKKTKTTPEESDEKVTYVTRSEGLDFRKIAVAMTRNNHKLNHATARNQTFSGIKEILVTATKKLGLELSDEELSKLSKDPGVHDALTDLLFLAHKKNLSLGKDSY